MSNDFDTRVRNTLGAIIDQTPPPGPPPTHDATKQHPTRQLAASVTAAVLVIAAGFFAQRSDDSIDVAAPAFGDHSALADLREIVQPAQREFIVWIEPRASEDSVEAIGTAIGTTQFVDDAHYVDQTETYAEFSDYWQDSPEILAAVDPEDLPTSYRVTLIDNEEVDIASLAAYFDQLSGVTTVDYDPDYQPGD